MDTITAKEMAKIVGVTPKRMRAFIRSACENGTPITTPDGVEILPVGSGNAYSFGRDEAHAIMQAFTQRTQGRRNVQGRPLDTLVAWLDESNDDADVLDADDDTLDA